MNTENTQDNQEPTRRPRKKGFRFFSFLIVTLIVGAGFGMLYYIVTQMSIEKGPDGKPLGEAQAKAEKEKKEKEKKEEEETPSIRVYKVSKGEFVHVMDTLGTIKAKAKVKLRFEVNGLVEVVNVEENDEIREGDIIAELGHQDAELKIDFRKSKLKEATIEMKNYQVKVKQNKLLLEAGAIAEEKYQESVLGLQRAKQAAKSAKIELKSAEAELEKTYLKSPIDGIVGTIKAHRGEFVSSQKEAFTILATEEVYCEFSVLEKDIQDVRPDQDISLSVDTYPGEKFRGKVVSMGAVVDTSEGRSRKVKAKFSNEDGKLMPGMFCHVNVILMQKQDAISIPNSAFANIEEDTSTVWVVEENDIVKRREVSVEHFSIDRALIESGLKVGDLVVIDVTTVKLKDDQKVEVVEVKEDKKDKK